MAKERKRKQYDDDDGRVIAPMNVDGMPWHDRHLIVDKVLGDDGKAQEDDFDYNSLSKEEKKAYRKETNAIIRGVIRQFLPYLLLFVGVGAVVVLILWAVWR